MSLSVQLAFRSRLLWNLGEPILSIESNSEYTSKILSLIYSLCYFEFFDQKCNVRGVLSWLRTYIGDCTHLAFRCVRKQLKINIVSIFLKYLLLEIFSTKIRSCSCLFLNPACVQGCNSLSVRSTFLLKTFFRRSFK